MRRLLFRPFSLDRRVIGLQDGRIPAATTPGAFAAFTAAQAAAGWTAA